MNWFKQQMANVAGTREPDYGPSAIQPVTAQAETKPYTELTPEDLKWKAMQSTCVETQVFYFMNEDGQQTMAQVIYSNVAGIRTTCQFNSKIFNHDGPNKHLWCSDPIDGHKFDDRKTGFLSDKCNVILNEAGDTYTIKSQTNSENIVDLEVKRAAPGFMVGENGTTFYGTDPKNPWGSMFHKFWPRCTVSGTMTTKKKTYEVKGRGLYAMALQGMKPHHAAARWNFIDFQTPTYSAVMMEFTTPSSYGHTVVNVGGIVKDGELVYAGVTNSIKHIAAAEDPVIGWPEPKAVLINWKGKNAAGQEVSAEIMGDLGERTDRVDVLAHVPTIIKQLIGGVVGTKPIIYQYASKDKLELKIKIGESETTEPGQLFSEATFIS